MFVSVQTIVIVFLVVVFIVIVFLVVVFVVLDACVISVVVAWLQMWLFCCDDCPCGVC